MGIAPDSSTGFFAYTMTDAAGNFNFPGTSNIGPGDWVRILVLPTTGKYVRGGEDGTANGWGASFEVAAGANTGHNITPVNLFSVPVNVKDTDAAAVSGTFLQLRDAQQRTIRGRTVSGGNANATGDLTFNGVMGGWYYVSASTSGATDYHLGKDSPIFPVYGTVATQNLVLGFGAKGKFTVTKQVGGDPVNFALVSLYNDACTTYVYGSYTNTSGELTSATFPAGAAHVWVTSPLDAELGDNAAGCASAPLVTFPDQGHHAVRRGPASRDGHGRNARVRPRDRRRTRETGSRAPTCSCGTTPTRAATSPSPTPAGTGRSTSSPTRMTSTFSASGLRVEDAEQSRRGRDGSERRDHARSTA